MKSAQQIKDQFEKWKDEFLSFRAGDILKALSLEDVRPYLKDDFDGEWTQLKTDEDVKAKILDYLPFAWEKANGCRGLSAGRSISHISAWLWLLGHDDLAEEIEDYSMYGKPQLVKVSEMFGFDWRAHDNNSWVNNEGEDGITADQALAA